MKRFFPFMIVLVVAVVGIGLYRGWFVVTKTPEPDSNKVDINVRVDPDKVKEDIEAVEEEVKELTGKVKEGTKNLGHQERDNQRSTDQ
jgi:hypothetical protein